MTETRSAIDIMYYLARPEFCEVDGREGGRGDARQDGRGGRGEGEDVSQYTQKYPDRFVGLAGCNPFRIKESLAEIETAVTRHGFKGG